MSEARRILEQASELTDEMVRDFAGRVKADLRMPAFDCWLSGKDIRLQQITVAKDSRKQGVGSEAMERLCQFADQHHARIILTTGVKDDRTGTTSTARLIRFYSRFGFKRNRGRNIDFTISANMIRDPK